MSTPAETALPETERIGWLRPLRDRVLAGDNAAAFVERETALQELAPAALVLPVEQRYAFLLAGVLEQLSTPIVPGDVLLGRMREARLPDGWKTPAVPGGLWSFGHLTPDYGALLAHGLVGIVAEAQVCAARHGDAESRSFATNSVLCAEAIRRFATRYATAARAQAQHADSATAGALLRAAEALERVPYAPATTFFEALQSVWLMHLVLSCVVGSRDFAFGRLDQWLLPYYRRELETGRGTRESMLAEFAHFLLKTNEITGTGAFNYKAKPIPSQSSKQYLIVGGRDAAGQPVANDLSLLVLEAAELVRLPEPVITIRLDPEYPQPFRERAAQACASLQSQVHVFNDAVVVPALERAGIPADAAADYTMIGCCRAEIPGCMDGLYSYHYHNLAEWLLDALRERNAPDMPAVLGALGRVARERVTAAVNAVAADRAKQPEGAFHLESVLIRDCVTRCRDYAGGGARYTKQGHFLGGIATVANSLTAIDRLVFQERRFSLAEFLAIVAADFAGHDALRCEIRNEFPTFGNDEPVADGWAAAAANTVLDAIACVPSPDCLFTGFYSLDSHHAWGRALPATPDGRRPGEPISENQSPVYGTDLRGVTALLKSVAVLPLHRTVMGGLNVKFGTAVSPQVLQSLLESYFAMGGIHVGFTMVDRATLTEARRHPDRHRDLCVRLYGFSEFYVNLSPDEQEELITRTEVT